MYSRFLFRYFRQVRRLSYWTREKFTGPGQMAWAALIVAALMGVDTNRTTGRQAFALLAVFMVLALFLSRFTRGRFAIRRETPRFGTAGEPLQYKVFVKNLSPRKMAGLAYLERTSDARPGLEALQRAAWPKGPAAVYRHLWEASQWPGRGGQGEPLPVLGPGAEAEIRVSITPRSRGRLFLPGASIACPDPLNLARSLFYVPEPQSVLILPRRHPVGLLSLPGLRRHQPGGFSRAHSVGDSEEFLSMREYRPGDPLRKIHWRSWAKTGKPIVREFQEEYYVRHALVLDTFQDGQSARVFEDAVSVAASFASAVQTRESLLDLMFVGNQAYCFTTGRGLGQGGRMMEILASVSPCHAKPFSSLPPVVLQRSSLLSGCICVFLCWDKQREDFVRQLQARGVPARVLVVTDAPESRQAPQPALFQYIRAGHVAEDLAAL